MGNFALDILEILGILLLIGAGMAGVYLLANFLPLIYYGIAAIGGGIYGVVYAAEDSSYIGEFFGGAFVFIIIALLVHGWLGSQFESEGKGKKPSASSGVSRREVEQYVRNSNAENIWFNAGFFGKLNNQNKKNVDEAYRRGFNDGFFDS